MLEVLVTIFVAAFVLITLYGHVLVVEALLTPDPAAEPTAPTTKTAAVKPGIFAFGWRARA